MQFPDEVPPKASGLLTSAQGHIPCHAFANRHAGRRFEEAECSYLSIS